MLSIDATRILLGAVLLCLGRRLFWLFVGAVGFVAGMLFAERFLQGQPEDNIIIFAIIVGVVSAAMAVAVRKVAVGAAGFLAGGYFLMQLLSVSRGGTPVPGAEQIAPALLFLIGGVVGAVLMNFLFNWALIVLSSLAGATLICKTLVANGPAVQNALSFFSGVKPSGEAAPLGGHIVSVVFTALAAIGILVQAGTFRRRRQAPPP